MNVEIRMEKNGNGYMDAVYYYNDKKFKSLKEAHKYRKSCKKQKSPSANLG